MRRSLFGIVTDADGQPIRDGVMDAEMASANGTLLLATANASATGYTIKFPGDLLRLVLLQRELLPSARIRTRPFIQSGWT